MGAGLMGRWHAKTAKRLGDTPVAIMDPYLSRSSELSTELDATAEIFTDIDKMLSRRLDIVHICTPLESHYSLVLQAIKSGAHVLVEKPVAATVSETESLLQEAR